MSCSTSRQYFKIMENIFQNAKQKRQDLFRRWAGHNSHTKIPNAVTMLLQLPSRATTNSTNRSPPVNKLGAAFRHQRWSTQTYLPTPLRSCTCTWERSMTSGMTFLHTGPPSGRRHSALAPPPEEKACQRQQPTSRKAVCWLVTVGQESALPQYCETLTRHCNKSFRGNAPFLPFLNACKPPPQPS